MGAAFIFATKGLPPGAVDVLQHYGVLALFLLVFVQDCGLPTLIPGSLLVLAGGYFVYLDPVKFPLHVVALTIATGGFLGASLFFWIARKGGRPLVLRLGRYVGLSERQFDAASHSLDRWGAPMLLITRVAPGTRVYMTAFAGISGWSYRRFAFWTGVFCLLWSYSFVLLGRALGPQWDAVAPVIARYSNIFIQVVLVLVVLAIVFFVYRSWRQARTHPASATPPITPIPPTQPKEQSRAHSDSRGGRVLRLADDTTPRPKRSHPRDRR